MRFRDAGGSTVGPVERIPIYDETVPVACTIGADEIPERVELIGRMRANLDRLERTEHGLLLHFPARADIEADLRRFAVDEKRCCAFWGFAVDTSNGLTLQWDGPPAAAPIVDGFEAFFTGDEPLTGALAGLL